jgi:hypothetical protein
MPRVIVTTDPDSPSPDPGAHHEPAVLLDEQIRTVHLATGHAAAQFVERVAWAISDAEDLDRAALAAGRA